MTKASNRRPPVEPTRESAWDLWRTLARGDAGMSENDAGREVMIERHKLVVSMIDVNSRQLRCDSAKAGLDIERACAVRDAASPDKAEEAKTRLQEIEERLAVVAEEQHKLATEREFLDSALAEYDASAPRPDDRVGRA